MIKNIIIALQAIIIGAGVLWAREYINRTEQIFYVNHLRIMANDIDLLTKLQRQIAAGETSKAQKQLSELVPIIVDEMEEHVGKLDPKMEDTLTTATTLDDAIEIAARYTSQEFADVRAQFHARGIVEPPPAK